MERVTQSQIGLGGGATGFSRSAMSNSITIIQE